ncbi:DBR1-domain-containing protein [Pholiota conissans]|uniref:DBR1-domain-containing protein n=1 Tax=Pholiota conissans TaxID=109636 RepID=A0A9P5Z473_9AGAR|nr:DBR1-domain-containing protein [Pholiota conissans]
MLSRLRGCAKLARGPSSGFLASPRFYSHRRAAMKIAVEGCCHGELDAIYSHIEQLETKNKYKVDALLICGDFQAVRNYQDLQCMAVPNKYKKLEQFYKYYTGEKVAPILTIVIGGNHEASNYMWELYHGGWLAPNIYFLGHAGSVRLNGIRIAGASGIFKAHDFRIGNYEKLPYDSGSMRSIYHIREYSVRKLSLLPSANVFLSHDWPQSIVHYGDLQDLLRRKSFFRQDIETGALGSPPLMGLLKTLKPEWWFAAHMHTRFEATVAHEDTPVVAAAPALNPDEIQIEDDEFETVPSSNTAVASAVAEIAPLPRNPDEIALDDEEIDVVAPPRPPAPSAETKFLALDKCLPRRQFLEVVDIDAPLSSQDSTTTQSTISSSGHPMPLLSFDPEWLAITRAFHPFLSTTRQQPTFPDEAEARALVAKEREWVAQNIPVDARGEIPVSEHQVFVMTAPGPGSEGKNKFQQPPWYTNPQTEAFCRMLDIPNKINPPPSMPTGVAKPSPRPAGSMPLDRQIGA